MLTSFPNLRAIGGVAVAIVACMVMGYLIFQNKAPEIVETPFVEPELPIETNHSQSKIIGQSVENREIVVHSFGNGPKEVLFVGGVHGGYEWNSVILAESMIEYFTSNVDTVPSDLTVSIIPVLNPDGLAKVTAGKTVNLEAVEISGWSSDGIGRFNANNVDLNRNFACKWQPQASWRGNTTSAGTAAFSEPEAQALRDYVLANSPSAVVFWHSVAGNVYGSECEDGILPVTFDLMNAYAVAGSYGSVPTFDAYPVTGDAEGWLASIGIPAITVELETRESIEWQRNLAGTTAIINLISDLAE